MWWERNASRPAEQAERVLQLGAAAEHRAAGRRRRAQTARARTRGSGGSAAPGRAPPAAPSRRRGCGSAGRGSRNGVGDRPAGRRRRRRGARSARRRRCRWSARSGAPTLVEQQVVQRRVGQQHPEVAVAGRDGRRHRGVGRGGAAGRSGRAARSAPPPRPGRSRPERAGGVEVGRPGRANGLSSRCLRARSARDGGLVGGERGQVVAAEALDGDAPPRPAARRPPRRSGRPSVRRRPRREPQRRTAVRAAHRLRVEPPVGRVVVLRARTSAHIGKPAIVVVDPVVGHAGDDREPRPAVRAVDERVAVAAVGRVAQLAQAVGAGRGVRRDERGAPGRARRSAAIVKAASPPAGSRAAVDARSPRPAPAGARAARRRNASTARRRGPRPRSRTPRSSLPTNPASPSSAGQPVHERPEPDALHDPGDPDRARPGAATRSRRPSACCTSSHSTW